MVTTRKLLKVALRHMKADGLYNPDGDGCGCDISDLSPCGYLDLDCCVPAKKVRGGYYPIEEIRAAKGE